jgi:hypothetical protein
MYTYIHLPQALSILCVNNVSYTLPYTDNHVVVALGKQYWVFDCWQLWPCRVSQSINSTSEWNVGFHAFPKHYLEKWNQAPIGCDISILYLHMWCTYWYVKIYTCIYIYIHINIWLCIYIYVYIYVNIYLLYIFIYLHIHTYIYICIYIYIYACDVQFLVLLAP